MNAATLPEASKQIINLGGTKFYSVNEANTILRKVVGYDNIEYVEARHEVKDAYPTWAKSQAILGYEFKTDLEEGLTKMWEWAKEQPIRERFFWKEYELEKGIYSYWQDEPSIRK